MDKITMARLMGTDTMLIQIVRTGKGKKSKLLYEGTMELNDFANCLLGVGEMPINTEKIVYLEGE